MPATDALQPILTDGEKKVVKSYGGWTSFMQSMGLKPWKESDAQEGKQIAASFASADEEDEAQTDNGTKSDAK